MRGGETWGNWGVCGFAFGARRLALRVALCGFGGRALPGGCWRSGFAGWASVAALWVCFDGAKIRFCSKENRFFGILHDEKAADCGGVLQPCGREPRASASLQPGGSRTRPDVGASLGAGGAPLPVATRSHAPSPTTCVDGSGSEGGAAARGSGTVRCGDVSGGSERAGEREQTPRGGCARRPAWRAKGYFRRLRAAGRGR